LLAANLLQALAQTMFLALKNNKKIGTTFENNIKFNQANNPLQ
jgi:hypothetical protein